MSDGGNREGGAFFGEKVPPPGAGGSASPATLARLVTTAVGILWKSDARTLTLSVILEAFNGSAVVLQVLLVRLLVTRLVPHGRTQDIRLAPAMLALVLLLTATGIMALAAAGREALKKLLGEASVRHVQIQIMDAAAAADPLDFERPEFFDRLQRAQYQGVPTPLMITNGVLQIISGLVAAIGIIVALLVIQPLVVPFALLGAVPLWTVAGKNSSAIYSFAFGNTPGDRLRAAFMTTVVGRTSALEVKAYNLYPFLRARWDALFAQRLDDARSVAKGQMRRTLVATVISTIVISGIFAVLVVGYVSGHTSLGATAAAAFATSQLGTRLLSLTGGVALVEENVLYLKDLQSFLATSTADANLHQPFAELQDPRFEAITLNGVCFSYPGSPKQALSDVSFTLRRGEVVALIGANGSGKSTLAKLLAGLYQPSEGSLQWDGINASDISRDDLYRRSAIIFQDFTRYPLTLAENVGVGRIEHLDDIAQVEAALERVGALQTSAALPSGTATFLGKQFEDGVDLSVGQWQAVALARAFFRDAPLIILDEPTAALDAEAERSVFDAINALSGGRTVVVISHRFSTVRSADRILVLDHGRLAEAGNHSELMARGGIYARMFNLQASAYLATENCAG